jgi:two-component system, NarL family, nitrate/nitrite response regulator NarL
VTVVIADSLSSRFAHIFATGSEAKLVGVCDPVVDLPDQLVLLQTDVLLLPDDIERRTLLPLLRAIRTHRHPAKVLIVTDRCDAEFIGTILRYGARGCLRSTSSAVDVLKAVAAVKIGDIWLERRLLADAVTGLIGERSGETAESTNNCSLTIRENAIVALVVRGLTNKEIAKELDVSVETVKKHLKRIFSKLGVRSRTQVVLSQLCDRIVKS